MFSVDQIVTNHFPTLARSQIGAPFLKGVLRRLLHEEDFQGFAERFPHLQGIEFVEQALQTLQFSYAVNDSERENIPASGRVLIVANHPIGSLDGLALLKLVHEIRSDVRIVANDLLTTIAPLRSLLLPVRNMTGTSRKGHINRIVQALGREQAIIIFPAGEVSRLGPQGIKDRSWHRGFLRIAEQAKAPILPIHISGRNSVRFYLASLLARPLSTLMLVGEMFRQKSKELHFTVGALIPYRAYSNMPLRRGDKVKLFQRHLYRIGQGKKPLFAVETAIARPERKADLKKAILQGERLGVTPDGKAIYLMANLESSPVMREIGRLREQAFRAVGEGSGQRRDLDRFDRHYRHLILWDEVDLEIAGAYRFVDAGAIMDEQGLDGLYSAGLFQFDEAASPFLRNGLELGRSFVQQRYWGKRSLDYLWYGIGAYLRANSRYRYLFGAVSISAAMPPLARDLLIYFYKLYFPGDPQLSRSRNPFSYSRPEAELAGEFAGNDYRGDLRRLKTLLGNLGTAIPPLYKQYAELCEPGGVTFLDFNIDPCFSHCVDGMVIVDLEKLKDSKKSRYLTDSILQQPHSIDTTL
jgi:putative hemolysin